VQCRVLYGPGKCHTCPAGGEGGPSDLASCSDYVLLVFLAGFFEPLYHTLNGGLVNGGHNADRDFCS